MAASPLSPNTIGDQRFASLTTFEDGLTALAGGAKTGATPITGQLTRFSTVANSGDSGLLPKIGVQQPEEAKLGALGNIVVVRNDGANSMQVFGSGSDTINGVATGTGVAVGAGKTAIFIPQAYTQSTNVGNWVMVLSA